MSTLTLHTCGDIEVLAASFVAATALPGDPFARPLLLVPGPGLHRWLSQQVALRSAADGQGVGAGFDVHPLAALESLVSGGAPDKDPWSPGRLVWSVLDLAGPEAGPGLEPLVRHLAANDQRYANALRIARLLSRYAEHRPAMLAAWSADPEGSRLGLGFDGWQVELWSRLRATIADPDPVTRRLQVAGALASGELDVAWPAVLVFAPGRATPAQLGLLSAVARRIPVDVWLPTSGPLQTRDPLAVSLGRRGRARLADWRRVADAEEALPGPVAPPTVLGTLQAAAHAGSVPLAADRPDASVSVHASHGPGRQVEVLREVLTGLFADHPTLEPRDVVIACPDPSALAVHLASAFGEPQGRPGWMHPGRRLRVQVAERRASDANQLYQLVRTVVQLGGTRATASDLLALCGHPFVARRFGFGGDDLERLEQLVGASAVRWGINAAHRARFGLAGIVQNTWQLGVQRLLLGEAFSDDTQASVGVVATVDDVTSTDAALVGSFAELVSRVGRVVAACAEPAPLSGWVPRLRGLVDSLTDVPFGEAWQLGQVWEALDDLDRRGGDSRAPLTAPDAVALLDGAFEERRTRPAFGTGSLVVCSLDALAGVPHRVVCLVGLDEREFPRRDLVDGDDLLRAAPEPGDPDPGADDRQAFLDALLCARERVVVVYQGRSSHTLQEYPPPAGVLDLLEALGRPPVVETLQPFAPVNFAGPDPRSFDAQALRGARALVTPRAPAPDRYEVGHLHRTAPWSELDVQTLGALLRHPVRYLLRQRAGLTLGDDEPLSDELPLEVGPLQEWALGDQLLKNLRAGVPLPEAQRALWLGGSTPPRQLGARVLERVSRRAHEIDGAFRRVAGAPPESHVVDVDVDGTRVTGHLNTRGGAWAEARYGRVDARHLGPAWVRCLALTVARGERTDAVLVGRSGAHRLSAPPVALAAGFLAELVDLARQGTEEVLPMPPRVALQWASERARGRDPLASARRLRSLWELDRDEAWLPYVERGRHPWSAQRREPDPWGHPEETTKLGALAALAWGPIVKAGA